MADYDRDRAREIDEEITRQQHTIEVSERLADAARQDAKNARERVANLRRELACLTPLPGLPCPQPLPGA